MRNLISQQRSLRFLVFLGLIAVCIGPFAGSGQMSILPLDESTLIIPTAANDRLGAPNSMAVGDFNSDGFQDILVGAANADRPGSSSSADNGMAYIVYGKKPFPAQIDLKSFTNASVVIIGADFGDRLGTAVAAGDVNGDGIDDVILGAPDADGPLNQDSETGEVYVIWGSTNLPQQIDLRQFTPPVTLIGRQSRAGFGRTLTALDFNGDGLSEVVVGQPAGSGPGGSRPGSGNAYVYFGKVDLRSPIPDVGYIRPNVTLYGRASGDTLASALSYGDFNADGLMDLVLGAPMADGPNGRKDAGEVYVLSGARTLPEVMDLASSTTTGTGSLQVIGADAGDHLGTSVSGGDANKDGFDDLLIGAPMAGGLGNARGFSGEAYLVLGRKDLSPVIDIADNGEIAIEVYGADSLDQLGNSVVLADTDGDGYAELVLGASNAKGTNNNMAGTGAVFVIKGRALFPSKFDLANEEANTIIRGANTGDAFGSALAVGTLEGDEKGNLLVGAVGADGPGGRTDSGLVYVFLTVEKEPPTVPVADAGPDWCVIPGTTLTLDGSGSYDPGGNPLTFLWRIVDLPDGSQAQLSDADTATPSLTADVVGEYVIELTVSTPQGGTASDEMSVFALTKGDVNFDGQIDLIDAQLVADYIVGLIEFTEQQKFAADVRPVCMPPDLAIDVNDVRWIAEFPFKGAQEPMCTDPVSKPRPLDTQTPSAELG